MKTLACLGPFGPSLLALFWLLLVDLGSPSCLPATISLFLIAAGFLTHYFFQNLCLCFFCLACGYLLDSAVLL